MDHDIEGGRTTQPVTRIRQPLKTWCNFRLGDVVGVVRGRSYRGDQLQQNSDVALVTLKSFARGGGYRHGGLKPYVGPYDESQVVCPGEIVVAQTDITQDADVIGKPAKVPSSSRYTTLVASLDAAIVRCTSDRVLDPDFLYYRLLADDYAQHAKSYATGTTVLHLHRDALANFETLLPPILEQQSIAHILGALDAKIELNRCMNETMELLARAVFKDWFIEFGPVRAKLKGQKPYLPAKVWDLFPEELDIDGKPVGWSMRSLDDIALFLNGLALQKYPVLETKPSLAVIKIAELRNGINAKSNRASCEIPEKFVVADRDFLFSWSGSLLAKFWTGGVGALNQHLFKVTSKHFPPWFFSQWIYHHLDSFRHIAASKATTMGHIKREHIAQATVICPPDDVLVRLGGTNANLLSRILGNEIQNRNLAHIRDVLLPKLVLGEIRIKDLDFYVGTMT